MTLTKAMISNASWRVQLGLVVAGSALIAVAAQVQVPMYPVPMTLQTLAILTIALSYGSRLGFATLVAYLAEGAAGLPVFAGGASTMALVGPTAGFLFGFAAMAWLVGYMVERGMGGSAVRMFLAAAVGTLLLYVPGLAWLWAATPLTLATTVKVGALPFLAGDLVKAAIAALIVSGGWEMVKRRQR